MKEYCIYPLGDSGVTINLGNRIETSLNEKAVAMQQWLQQHPFSGLTDIIVAYSSLSVMYEPAVVKAETRKEETVYNHVCQRLETAYAAAVVSATAGKLIRIPVCYEPEMAPDLSLVATEKQLTTADVIALHTGSVYRVYMIGFLPGFPYMASVDEKISMPRKQKPRQAVPRGSVGIAGIQTGIYPLESPGGWQIIGRTPVRLFDTNDKGIIRIKAGDLVQFYPVTRSAYKAVYDIQQPATDN